ncbi:type VI secretion system baseplate subunit TssG [Burkholderia thailandensis]|uniref:type VI secretion system baseplate subunit TssG n=1 Tax=Burkholderia thailandensis TaxID=57975 RepID=UPI00107E727D|nr:type VI secretion system baseplate subunit TssG [Burkholderia thailandensis]TGB30493.1 type VI secretion system baseplate subunit TssG [Burkholderia thailandensis]
MPALEPVLLGEAKHFAYFQAIRLLRRIVRERREHHAGAASAPAAPMPIHTRPNLALSFPDTDVERIDKADDGGYRVVANFFGLYGVSSPLPTFYTEDLIDEAFKGRHATRGFLDVLHRALYPLLFDAWLKHRLSLRIVEERDAHALRPLYALAGVDARIARDAGLPEHALLRHVGLLSQRPRSASGLRALLADAFAPAAVDIEPCVPQWLPIPDDQRTRVGARAHRLGVDARVGARMRDDGARLRIVLRDVPGPLFRALMPGGDAFRRLRFLVRLYLTQPFTVDVAIRVRARDALPARCGGGAWSRVGLDAWLGGPPAERAAAPEFRLPTSLFDQARPHHAAG